MVSVFHFYLRNIVLHFVVYLLEVTMHDIVFKTELKFLMPLSQTKNTSRPLARKRVLYPALAARAAEIQSSGSMGR